MKLTIEINGDNSAFEDNPIKEFNNVINTIHLNSFAEKALLEGFKSNLYDSNGNKVGFIKLK